MSADDFSPTHSMDPSVPHWSPYSNTLRPPSPMQVAPVIEYCGFSTSRYLLFLRTLCFGVISLHLSGDDQTDSFRTRDGKAAWAAAEGLFANSLQIPQLLVNTCRRRLWVVLPTTSNHLRVVTLIPFRESSQLVVVCPFCGNCLQSMLRCMHIRFHPPSSSRMGLQRSGPH